MNIRCEGKYEIADLHVFSQIFFTDFKTSINKLLRTFLNQKDFINCLMKPNIETLKIFSANRQFSKLRKKKLLLSKP